MRLGFDVGGTKTDAVAVAPTGAVVARVRRPTGWGPHEVVGTVLELSAELAEIVGVPASSFRSIGIGMPGQVALGVPVRAENDVKAAAVGAHALHGARVGGAESVAYLNLGTGVAAGFVVGGALWRGAHGTAGEVGHISVDPNGPECKCGQRGCIEAFCGGGSIARRWGRPAALPVLDVFDAADAGDAHAIELRAGLAYGVASAIRMLVLSGDVDVVLLGGGVTALGDRMLSLVVAELASRAAASPFLRSLRIAERVEMLPPGSPAAALGAAIIGAEEVEQEAVSHG